MTIQAGSNFLNVSMDTVTGQVISNAIKSCIFPGGSGWSSVSVGAGWMVNITRYLDVNGSWIPANKTVSKSGFTASFTFDELSPAPGAVAVRGYVIAKFPTGAAGYWKSEDDHCIVKFDGENGTKLEIYDYVNDAGEIYRTVYKLYQGDQLVGLFDAPHPEAIATEFELNLQLGNLTIYGSSALPTTWDYAEGCGFRVIGRTGGFSVVWYATDQSAAAASIAEVDERIREDSHNLSWIESFRIEPAIDLESLAASKNKTVAELVPADFGPYRAAAVTIISLPSGFDPIPGALAIAAEGVIFTKTTSVDVILHEIAHEAGFCDDYPGGPYAQWKDYWSNFLGAPISQFTNATWYFEQNGFKLWAYMPSSPIFLSGHEGPLVLRLRSNEARTVTITVEVADGSVDPSSRSISVSDTWRDAEFTFTPPEVQATALVQVTFHVSEPQSGLERDLPFWLTILPEGYVNLTSDDLQRIYPPEWPGFNDTILLPPDFYDKLDDVYGNLSQDFTEADAIEYAMKAEYNAQKAQDDATKAQQAAAENKTCEANLWSQAAQARLQAANYYASAAVNAEKDWEAFDIRFNILNDDPENLAAIAEQYERKAVGYETQAALGCPSSSRGLSVLAGLVTALGMGANQEVMMYLFVLGLFLTFFGGLISTFRATRDLGKFLAVIGVILMLIGGIGYYWGAI